MSKISYLAIPPELELLYWSGLQSGDRYVSPRIRVKTGLLSKEKLLKLSQRSLLPAISELWASFTSEQRASWKSVDFHSVKHGWRSFVSDQSRRLKLGLPGTATPNIYHQNLIGRIVISAPASEILISQPHPYSYWTSHKVSGKKSMYELVNIVESFVLPFKIGISYKSNLASTGAGSYAKFYADVLYLYQGQNLHTNLELNFDLVHDWTRLDDTLASVVGRVVSYSLYISCYNVVGELYFDNVVAEHSGLNWARDIYCQNVSQGFTHAFFQVPKHWAPVIMPNGSGYDSIYGGG